jgi:hypothetical protein
MGEIMAYLTKLKKIFLFTSLGLIGLALFGKMMIKKRFDSMETPIKISSNAPVDIQKKHVIIFIHGTSAAHLSPLDLWHPRIVKDLVKRIFTNSGERLDLQKHSLTRVVNDKFRRTKFIKGSAGAMHDEGLFEISRDVLDRYPKGKLSKEEKRLSAIHIAYAFDQVRLSVNSVNKDSNVNETCDYYTFGWKGLLDKNCRIDSAYDLYEELLQLKADKITLITHSYGGAVALYLADVQEQEKGNLVIEDLIMYAPPIEEETAQLALKPPFKNIFTFYSEGDVTQVADKFTTEEGICHRTLSSHIGKEIEKLDGRIIKDICFVVNGSRKYFDHMGPWSTSFSPKVLQMLKPFPAIVLTPFFIDLLRRSNCNVNCEMHIIDCDQRFMVDVRHRGSKESIIDAGEVSDLVSGAQKLMNKNWDPTYNFFALSKIGKVIPLFSKKSGV